MARLGVYRDFFRRYLKLEKSVQDQIVEVFSKFGEATYAGLHLEPVKNARDRRMLTIHITDFWARGGARTGEGRPLRPAQRAAT